jgi:hypothetical protein
VRKAVLTAPNLKTLQPAATREAAKVCAIPLLSVPVRNHIDDGIFLKGVKSSVDQTFGISPAVPACP